MIADPANDGLVIVASLWKIIIKARQGTLEADIDEVVIACERGGIVLPDIGPMHLRTLSKLAVHHRDLFDHR